MVDSAARAALHGRPHAALPEERADAWQALHNTFVREAREAGVAGRPRCSVLFLGDSITEVSERQGAAVRRAAREATAGGGG